MEEHYSYPEVLYMEDTPEDAEMTIHILQKYNLVQQVKVLEDGQEALDYVFSYPVHASTLQLPRLILLDLKLPKVSGLELLGRLKSHPVWKQVPVVVFTSSNQISDIEHAYKLGANSYVVKPVDFQAFAEVIRQIGTYWLVFNHASIAPYFAPSPYIESMPVRVLVLEDTPEDAELMLWELEKANMHIESMVVDNEQDFCRCLAEFHPHVILSDYVLPTFSGFDAFGVVQKTAPYIPFIFITSAIGKSLATETILDGASGFLLKSELEKLPPLVKETLGRSQPQSTPSAKQTVHRVNRQIQANVEILEKLKEFIKRQNTD